MALGLVFGLLVLCSRLCLLSAEHCPWSYSFPCGSLGNFYFPFTNTTNPGCGLCVRGCGDPGSTVEVSLGNENKTWLQVESIENNGLITSKMMVRDNGLQRLLSSLYSDGSEGCRVEDLHNVTLPPASPIMSFEKHVGETLSLYKCNDLSFGSEYFDNVTYCYNNDNNDFVGVGPFPSPKKNGFLVYHGLRKGHALPRAFLDCTNFQIPAKSEFSITVTFSEDCQKCLHERGRCRLDDKEKFRCVFEEPGRGFVNVLTVATAASAAMVVMLMVLGCCIRRKVTSASILFWKGENPTHKKIEIFLKRHEFHLTKRYTYSEIREMTNSFGNKLGQGGYGSVYKGKLHDGRLVAVKVLNNLKGNGEEFINEVASISQTSHVNIVSLFGFCFQGSKRALVYEFMPNGSLEKFIYEDNAATVDRQLDCKTLHDIAIGTARGLEYLHRGCNTRILHFDIKPHNILLDVDFCPKISDFGLSKICPRKESIVSMLVARGTAGYIAPEVFSRNFGGVSHKSDVYSFGMMVLEMVGGRRNINVEVECSSEIYFPHWIYKSLEKNQQLALRCIKNENDNEIIRKMILVSLWCIQTDPSARPAMSKVVDMLEGSLESLQIPPKPFLSSPKSSPTHYSTSNL